jgi:hypothetical protein
MSPSCGLEVLRTRGGNIPMANHAHFKSAEHKQRLLTTMQELGKIYRGTLDEEYLSALYILTADRSTWQKASQYVSRDGIDITAMLKEVDFSGGYGVLIQLAGNLFNQRQHLDPIELLRLDEHNFRLALTAIALRRYGLRFSDLADQAAEEGGVA